jgi:hypothetical protein
VVFRATFGALPPAHQIYNLHLTITANMPPKKRKAAEAAVDGEESHIFKSQRVNGRSQAATAAAGRPRRSAGSATEAKASAPKPKTKSAPKSVSNSVTKPAKSTTESDAPKRRGRPPKALTAAVPAKSESKTKPTSTAVVNNGAVKKRGRPSKAATTVAAPKEVKKAPKQGTRSSLRLSSTASTTSTGKVSFAKTTATIPATSTKATSGKPRGRPSAKSILKNGDVGENVSAEEDGADPLNGADQNGEVTDGVSTKEVDRKETENAPSYWLMKAEPETRMEKGVDVKFSIDDLAAANEPQGWDGMIITVSYSSE